MTTTPARIPTFTVGDRMRKARDVAELTAEQMAAELRARGVKATGGTTVTYWEREAGKPRDVLATLEAWAEITGVPLWWLITGQDLGGNASAWNAMAA